MQPSQLKDSHKKQIPDIMHAYPVDSSSNATFSRSYFFLAEFKKSMRQRSNGGVVHASGRLALLDGPLLICLSGSGGSWEGTPHTLRFPPPRSHGSLPLHHPPPLFYNASILRLRPASITARSVYSLQNTRSLLHEPLTRHVARITSHTAHQTQHITHSTAHSISHSTTHIISRTALHATHHTQHCTQHFTHSTSRTSPHIACHTAPHTSYHAQYCTQHITHCTCHTAHYTQYIKHSIIHSTARHASHTQHCTQHFTHSTSRIAYHTQYITHSTSYTGHHT